MKIIQLIQKPQRRGAEIFAAQLSEQLRLKGHELILVSIFEGNADLPFNSEFVELNRPIANRFFDFKGWNRFAQLVKEFQPDLIQANAADTLKFVVFSKKLLGWTFPIVYRNANQMGDFISGTLHRKFNQWLINSLSGVISVSKASQSDFHKTFTFPDSKSISIPIGIDCEGINKKINNSYLVDLPVNYLLQIGGLVPEKNPMGMIPVFERISENYPNLHLVFLGSGTLEQAVKAKLKASDYEGRIHLIQNQENIFPILSQAKALVMPSKVEGLPGVILEAMYCRVPVIAYGVGGIPEVLVTHRTGWCIPPANQNAFISGIEEVLSMDVRRKETILSSAFELVSTKFTLEKVARQFEDFYKRLLNSPLK